MPSEHDSLTVFMRRMAFQQFPYQREFIQSNFVRQILLMGEAEDNSFYSKAILSHIGMTMDAYVKLLFILIACELGKNTPVVNLPWDESKLSGDEIERFLESISVDHEDLTTILRREYKGVSSNEYFEQTPFFQYPLVRLGGRLVCVHPSVLYRSIESNLYDTLKAINPIKFMDKFGKDFERYVEKCLRYAGCTMITEKDLKSLVGSGSKLVDFIVVEDEARIFIDAKAVEMSYQGKVTHLKEVVRDRSKVSIIKAIKQANEVMQCLDRQGDHTLLRSSDENYLLVVTYKEFHIGNGRTFYETIARDKLDEIAGEHDGNMIPWENIYFITIEDLEYLSEGINCGDISLLEALRRAKADDEDVATQKFDFIMHLNEWGCLSPPQFLSDKYEEIHEKILNDINS